MQKQSSLGITAASVPACRVASSGAKGEEDFLANLLGGGEVTGHSSPVQHLQETGKRGTLAFLWLGKLLYITIYTHCLY